MPKPKLLDQVRDAIRVKHYSMRTEEAYVHWIKRFIFFHEKGIHYRWEKLKSASFFPILLLRERCLLLLRIRH
ncbi:MAG: hypothetical protein F9K48_09550 [Candidatus Brocadia sp.]|nr:MAG: hypothetical protein F9K48_09550 [Candidatus Brocadia sp.]